MRNIVLFSMVALMVSCQTLPPATDADRSMVFSESLSTVFDAVKSYMFFKGAEITSGSKESGLLTARIPIDTLFISAMADRQIVMYWYYRFAFNETPDGTNVLLSITAKEESGQPTEAKSGTYQTTWDGVRNNIR